MEHTGGESARPFVDASGATFPTVIDEHGLASSVLGFKAVPNGVLLDEDGIIRFTKYGGFSVDKPGDVAIVEQFLRGEDLEQFDRGRSPYQLGPTEQALVDTRLRYGRLLDSLGRREEAIQEWQAALWIDPANLVIRKQIWVARYPERFFPTIDSDWQKEQIRREREEEISAGICGPDGCPLPERSEAS